MKKNNRQKHDDIQSMHLRANTGEPFAFPCKLNAVQNKEVKHKMPTS